MILSRWISLPSTSNLVDKLSLRPSTCRRPSNNGERTPPPPHSHCLHLQQRAAVLSVTLTEWWWKLGIELVENSRPPFIVTLTSVERGRYWLKLHLSFGLKEIERHKVALYVKGRPSRQLAVGRLRISTEDSIFFFAFKKGVRLPWGYSLTTYSTPDELFSVVKERSPKKRCSPLEVAGSKLAGYRRSCYFNAFGELLAVPSPPPPISLEDGTDNDRQRPTIMMCKSVHTETQTKWPSHLNNTTLDVISRSTSTFFLRKLRTSTAYPSAL